MRPIGGKSLVLRKGAWSVEEDNLLKNYIHKHGEGKWHLVPLKAGLNRCRKSCRLRWMNYLRPNIKRGDFEEDEVDLIHRLHKLLGNRWSLIAGRIPGRTANDVKNYWNTHVLPRPKPQKQEIKERSQRANVSIIRPLPHTFSKTLKIDGLAKVFNTSTGLLLSPTESDDMINEYLGMEGFDRAEKEDGENNLLNFPKDDICEYWRIKSINN